VNPPSAFTLPVPKLNRRSSMALIRQPVGESTPASREPGKHCGAPLSSGVAASFFLGQ